MSKKLLLLAFISIVLAHIYKLGLIPKGFHSDEVSSATNAIFIARTGADEYGVRFPVYFKAFGDYKNPPHIYMTALIFRLFGVSLFNLRVGAFIYFMLGFVALFYLAKELWPDSRISQLFLALSIGFLPQYFTVSRIGFAINGQFATIALALLFTYLSFEKETTKAKATFFSVLSGAFMGLSVYAYTTGRLISFLLMLSVGFIYLSRKNVTKLLTYTISAVVFLIPYFRYYLSSSSTLTLRLEEISYFFNPEFTKGQLAAYFAKLYVSYFLPTFQVLTGDTNLRHHTGSGGMVFKVVYVLFLLALVLFWKNYKTKVRTKRFWVVVFILLLLAPVGGAISDQGFPHSLRSFMMGISIVLIATQGFYLLLARFDRNKKRIVVGAIFLFLALEIASYQSHYFSDYTEESIPYFFSYGLGEALVIAKEQKPKEIRVTTLRDHHLPFYLEVVDILPKITVVSTSNLVPGNDVCIIYKNNALVRKKLAVYNDLYPSYESFSEKGWLVRMRCYD